VGMARNRSSTPSDVPWLMYVVGVVATIALTWLGLAVTQL
jgi:hypothetical protein